MIYAIVRMANGPDGNGALGKCRELCGIQGALGEVLSP